MKKVALFLIALIALAGCASVTPIMPEFSEVFKPYPTGEVVEKSVGEQMIGYNLFLKARAYPGFVAIDEFQPPAIGPGQTLPAIKTGSEWRAIAKTEDGSYLCRNTKVRYRSFIGFTEPKTLSDWDVCLLVNAANEPSGGAICETVGNTTTFKWAQKPENFLKPKKIYERKNESWREAFIIYAGKTKDGVRFLYQETALKDLEFTFDLSESHTIAIKDITFEIIEATNTSIKYIIKTKPEELKSKIEEREKKASQEI